MTTCYVFNKKSDLRTDFELGATLERFKEQQDVVWINLQEPTPEELKIIGNTLGLHELTLEDLQNPKVRPKVEEFEDHLFVVFKAMNFNVGEDILDVINLNFLLFKNTLITVHLKPLLSIPEILEEIRKQPNVMGKGPAFIMYSILDRVIDRYFPLIEELDDTTEDIQSRIFEKFDPEVSATIFEWKTKVAHLRRRTGPQREIMMSLANRPHPLIPTKVQVYFRDVYDHLIRIHDNLESYREILQGAMDSYMTQVSNRMNQVMKTLSIVATIMLPLGILTGLYGTNFEILPGSKEPGGFWIFLAIIVVFGLSATMYFKVKKWF